MALILLRHTKPQIADGVCYGQLDIDVTSGFDTDASACLAKIPTPHRIISSPLQRCTRLAQKAATHFNLKYSLEPALIEMNFGDWEGVPWADIPRHELDRWADDFLNAAPHGGECVRDLKTRVEPFLRTQTLSNETTLAITHAGIMKVAAALQGHKDAWETSPEYGSFITYAD